MNSLKEHKHASRVKLRVKNKQKKTILFGSIKPNVGGWGDRGFPKDVTLHQIEREIRRQIVRTPCEQGEAEGSRHVEVRTKIKTKMRVAPWETCL